MSLLLIFSFLCVITLSLSLLWGESFNASSWRVKSNNHDLYILRAALSDMKKQEKKKKKEEKKNPGVKVVILNVFRETFN